MVTPEEEIIDYIDENIIGLIDEEKIKLKDFLDDNFTIVRKEK